VRSESLLVRLAVAVPVLYFGVMLVAASTWPGYSHASRYVSELGGPEAPRPAIFNTGIVIMGVVCALSAWGVFGAARRVGGRGAMSAIAALCIALFGVAMVMGGLFPMPDERHGAFGLGFAMVFAPLFLALAFAGRPGFGGLVALLSASFVFMVATMAVMMGVGHLVTRANVGIWQRLNALAMFPWLGIAGAILALRLGRRSEPSA
jgi:hypothetical membrane protein